MSGGNKEHYYNLHFVLYAVINYGRFMVNRKKFRTNTKVNMVLVSRKLKK